MTTHTVPPHHGPGSLAPDELRSLADGLGIEIWTPGPERGSRRRAASRAARESVRGRLPPRYATDTWHVPFQPRLESALVPGVRILDVGAGARPMVLPADRPPGTRYVGLDLLADELEKAPPGSYDDFVVADVCDLRPELVGQFDLVVSWLTMEHVRDVPRALHTLSRYQKPGGRFLGYLAGKWSAHAVLNRVVPHAIAKRAMRRLLQREPDTVFRAYYDSCSHDELQAVAREAWSESVVVPLFTGGWYFRFSGVVRAPYLVYEEWAWATGRRNLASYYLIDAIR